MFVSVNKFCPFGSLCLNFSNWRLMHFISFHALDPNQSESIRISKEYVYLDPSRYFGSKARGGGAWRGSGFLCRANLFRFSNETHGGDTPSQMLVWSLTRTLESLEH